MVAVELLGALGAAGAYVSNYNRKNYQFDQDQRFERDELRMKMQIERFKLFREDVRDLVELTVGKMDLYHLVGALFLKACILFYCKGVIDPPAGCHPWLLALYYISCGCAFAYLLLAIWLAMHASISCTGWGTQLLVRFLRLPIPGSKDLNLMNAKLQDFERQGLQGWRIPFLQRKANAWKARSELERESSESPVRAISRYASVRPKTGKPSYVEVTEMEEVPIGNEDEMLQAVHSEAYRHVQLFRRLQARWQCFDGYARVCMHLGVRAMIQAINYFLIAETYVIHKASMSAIVLTIVYQGMALSLSRFDIHLTTTECWLKVLNWVHYASAVPAFLTLSGVLLQSEWLAAAAFPFEILYCQLLYYISAPTEKDSSLPSLFRQVLFMDVFSDIDDPTRETSASAAKKEQDDIENVEVQRAFAKAALQRWQFAEECNMELSSLQKRTLRQCESMFEDASEQFHEALERLELEEKDQPCPDIREWQNLSEADREEDAFAGAVVGPFDRCALANVNQECYFNPETVKVSTDASQQHLTIAAAVAAIMLFQREVGKFHAGVGPPSAPVSATVAAEPSDTDTNRSKSSVIRAQSTKVAAHSAKVEQLPWNMVRTMIRVVQISWFFSFMVVVIHKIFGLDADHAASNFLEERRLAAAVDLGPGESGGFSDIASGTNDAEDEFRRPASWLLEKVEVAWPHGGAFFQPEALACSSVQLDTSFPSGPQVTDDTAPDTMEAGFELMVASPFAHYRAVGLTKSFQLEELPGDTFPPGSTTICRPSLQDLGQSETRALSLMPRCFVAEATTDGITLRPLGKNRSLSESLAVKVQGAARRPWSSLAGAIVPCGDSDLLTAPIEATAPRSSDQWCFLLAGSGRGVTGADLSVALVPWLPDHDLTTRGHQDEGAASATLARVLTASALDLSLPRGVGTPRNVAREQPVSSSIAVVALHVEPRQGRLWATTSSGEVHAWSLLHGAPQHLGWWRPVVAGQAENADLRITGVCEAPAVSTREEQVAGGREAWHQSAVFLVGRIIDALDTSDAPREQPILLRAPLAEGSPPGWSGAARGA